VKEGKPKMPKMQPAEMAALAMEEFMALERNE
jgi:hypothetical protein